MVTCVLVDARFDLRMAGKTLGVRNAAGGRVALRTIRDPAQGAMGFGEISGAQPTFKLGVNARNGNGQEGRPQELQGVPVAVGMGDGIFHVCVS